MKTTSVQIYRPDGSPAFVLSFIGLSVSALASVPDGGQIVRQALRRKGLNPDDYIASPFGLWDSTPGRGRGGRRSNHRH